MEDLGKFKVVKLPGLQFRSNGNEPSLKAQVLPPKVVDNSKLFPRAKGKEPFAKECLRWPPATAYTFLLSGS